MLRALGKAEDASIAYGEFRRFAILMPRDKLVSDKALNLKWFESATCVPIGGVALPAAELCRDSAPALPWDESLRVMDMQHLLESLLLCTPRTQVHV